MDYTMKADVQPERLLLHRRHVAIAFDCSQAQVCKYDHWDRSKPCKPEGDLHPRRIPGQRAVRYDPDEVRALVRRWLDASPEELADLDRRAREARIEAAHSVTA
jgi:uncharacterized membrane protein